MYYDRTWGFNMRRKLGTIFLALLLGAGVLAVAAAPLSAHPPDVDRRPIVFVHGGAGSGAQFESQAMRFTSNGYPADRIRVLEYNSFDRTTFGEIPARLDALIAELTAATGFEQIDLLGHSLGTGLMQSYLSDPARAAKVAHYVNVDGATAGAPPGGVPTLALWAEGSPTRQIVGATNVYIPEQSHVQIATSRVVRGHLPVLQRRVETSHDRRAALALRQGHPLGRAVNFPANSGVTDATLEIYKVDPATGARRGGPKATFPLAGDGAWGPFEGRVGKSYEMAIVPRDWCPPHLPGTTDPQRPPRPLELVAA